MYDIINEIDFFCDWNLQKIECCENNQFLIKSDRGEFLVRFFPIDDYGNIIDKKNKINYLIDQGFNLYPILNCGILENHELCYGITNNIGKIKRYDNDVDNYRLGYNIGEIIREYHSLCNEMDTSQWTITYGHKINSILHEYGLGDYRGSKDFILLDYIHNNRHLIMDRKPKRIFSFYNICDIPIDENDKVYLFGNQEILFADPYYEFKNINVTNYYDEAYAYGLINGYFNGNPPRLFFKTLAFYTIVEHWASIFERGEAVSRTVLELITEEILTYYDDFGDIHPKWYKEIKNKLEISGGVV